MVVATRLAFGEELINIARINKNFIVCSTDTKNCGIDNFGQLFPNREYCFGIAEQNLVGSASGFASCGHKVVVIAFATFISMRSCEQIRSYVCYPNLNVTIVGTHAGLQDGGDGATHEAIEDVAIMRSFPNMTIIQPSDEVSARAAAKSAIDFVGPLYVRLHRESVRNIHNADSYSFKIGQADVLRDYGNDVAIIGTGILMEKALDAADTLRANGIKPKVIEVHTIKPLDQNTIIQAAKSTGAIVTVEDHNIIGGLGSAVAEVISEHCPVILKRIGVKDVFGESGDPESLFDKFGMSINHIVDAAKEVLLCKTMNKREV
jgi:transketolase